MGEEEDRAAIAAAIAAVENALKTNTAANPPAAPRGNTTTQPSSPRYTPTPHVDSAARYTTERTNSQVASGNYQSTDALLAKGGRLALDGSGDVLLQGRVWHKDAVTGLLSAGYIQSANQQKATALSGVFGPASSTAPVAGSPTNTQSMMPGAPGVTPNQGGIMQPTYAASALNTLQHQPGADLLAGRSTAAIANRAYDPMAPTRTIYAPFEPERTRASNFAGREHNPPQQSYNINEGRDIGITVPQDYNPRTVFQEGTPYVSDTWRGEPSMVQSIGYGQGQIWPEGSLPYSQTGVMPTQGTTGFNSNMILDAAGYRATGDPILDNAMAAEIMDRGRGLSGGEYLSAVGARDQSGSLITDNMNQAGIFDFGFAQGNYSQGSSAPQGDANTLATGGTVTTDDPFAIVNLRTRRPIAIGSEYGQREHIRTSPGRVDVKPDFSDPLARVAYQRKQQQDRFIQPANRFAGAGKPKMMATGGAVTGSRFTPGAITPTVFGDQPPDSDLYEFITSRNVNDQNPYAPYKLWQMSNPAAGNQELNDYVGGYRLTGHPIYQRNAPANPMPVINSPALPNNVYQFQGGRQWAYTGSDNDRSGTAGYPGLGWEEVFGFNLDPQAAMATSYPEAALHGPNLRTAGGENVFSALQNPRSNQAFYDSGMGGSPFGGWYTSQPNAAPPTLPSVQFAQQMAQRDAVVAGLPSWNDQVPTVAAAKGLPLPGTPPPGGGTLPPGASQNDALALAGQAHERSLMDPYFRMAGLTQTGVPTNMPIENLPPGYFNEFPDFQGEIVRLTAAMQAEPDPVRRTTMQTQIASLQQQMRAAVGGGGVPPSSAPTAGAPAPSQAPVIGQAPSPMPGMPATAGQQPNVGFEPWLMNPPQLPPAISNLYPELANMITELYAQARTPQQAQEVSPERIDYLNTIISHLPDETQREAKRAVQAGISQLNNLRGAVPSLDMAPLPEDPLMRLAASRLGRRPVRKAA